MAPVTAFIRPMLDGLVHASVAGNPLLAARHRAFIGSQLMLGFTALAGFPAWLAAVGAPSPAAAVTFAMLTAPLGLAAWVSRTGQFEAAQFAWSLLLTLIIGWIAVLTGGVASPAMIGLVLVPIEASLAGLPRVALSSAAIAGCGAIGIYQLSGAPVEPIMSIEPVSALLVALAAIAYAGTLALRLDLLHRFSDNAARSGEWHYRLLAENATDLITLHDLSGGTKFASPAARILLGAGPVDLAGVGLFERVHVADRPAYLSALSQSANSGHAASAEFRLRRSIAAGQDGAGTFLWAEMRCRPARDAEGRIIAVVAVTRDISGRKSLEAEIVAAREIAERASAAKSRFLAMMSHELRTPLNAIIGFSEILMTGLFGPAGHDRSRDYARLIHESGEHLLEVVNGILDMSKIEAGKFEIQPEPFRVEELVAGCRDMIARQADARHITIATDIAADLPELAADPRAVRQILINLLSNAIKFSNEGGIVTVSARPRGAMLALAVGDTGIGIRPEDLDRLGLPFEQVDSSHDRRYQGTGLGLSVVKGLTALHGGQFAITSKPGRGTTVTIELPLSQPRAGAGKGTPQGIPQPRQVVEEERKIA